MSRCELVGVQKSFGALRVLPPVTVLLEPGEALGLWGPTGCGKTTLLRIIAGISTPDAGSVQRGGSIGVVFQDLALWPHMSARRHLEYVLSAVCKDRSKRRSLAVDFLECVDLADHAAKRPETMSRGQRQRLAIARALCNSPGILLLDEPVSSQDSASAERMLHLFRQHKANGGLIVVSAHDKGFLKALCDRVLVFERDAVECVGVREFG